MWSREKLENVCHAEAARGNALLDKVKGLKHELDAAQKELKDFKDASTAAALIVTQHQPYITSFDVLEQMDKDELKEMVRSAQEACNDFLKKADKVRYELEISNQRVDRAKAVARDSLADLNRVKADAERVKKEAEHDLMVAREEKKNTKDKLIKANGAKRMLEIELQEANARILRTDECLNNEHDLKVRAENQARTAEATLREARQKIDEVQREKNIHAAAAKKERKDRIDVQKRLDAMTAAMALRVTVPHGTGCVVCGDGTPATHLMTQCGHTTLCRTCADTFVEREETTCYLCRARFDKNKVRPVVQVYAGAGDETEEQEDPNAWFHDSLFR